MKTKIFRIGGKGLERIDVPENHAKNNLSIGTVLQLQGYSCPKYVIVENRGISERFSSYGSRYLCVNLSDYTFKQEDAVCLRYISEKKDQRIQMYITDKILPSDNVLEIWEKAKTKEAAQKSQQVKDEEQAKQEEIKGREILAQHIPSNAKALIIAELEVDNCDLMTDYFSTKRGNLVVLGWSKHQRDLFSEMRKHAHKIPETAHLATKPEIDSNGHPQTETNKSWWTPADEHREKYSMGAGYYLKASSRYSTGWRISKRCKWGDDWDNEVYRSLAKKCVL